MKEIEWVETPWGMHFTVHSDEHGAVKILEINPGHALSLQFHNLREEYWTLLSASRAVEFTIGDEVLTARTMVRYDVPKRQAHRISNGGWKRAQVLEVIRGTLDEEDVVRLSDLYGRS